MIHYRILEKVVKRFWPFDSKLRLGAQVKLAEAMGICGFDKQYKPTNIKDIFISAGRLPAKRP
jgi:hypothetical protein